MAAVVSIDTQSMVLERYEIGGSNVRRTHSCELQQLAETLPALAEYSNAAFRLVMTFRVMPDKRFAVEPPPKPTNPPAAAGQAYFRKAA